MPKCFDFFSKNLFFHHEHSTLYAYWERSVKNTYLVFQYICSSRERRPFRVLCDRHNVLVSKLFKFVQCSTFVHIFNSEALFDDDINCPTLRGIAHKLFVKTELWFGDRCIRGVPVAYRLKTRAFFSQNIIFVLHPCHYQMIFVITGNSDYFFSKRLPG